MTDAVGADGARVDRPLSGCAVVVTRERAGELGRLLAEAGADVIHVPLIEVVDPDPADRRFLADALADRPDWIVVTSAAGADRVGDHVAADRQVKLAAVGTATAERLSAAAGRGVDLVPQRQLAVELATAFNRVNDQPQRVLIAQADRAGSMLAEALRHGGHEVVVATAYRTLLRHPTTQEVARLRSADAVTFASGSAAAGWAAGLAPDAEALLPGIVAVIGPSTADSTRRSGLKYTHVAADHSLAGLIDALTSAWLTRGKGDAC